MRGLTTKWTPAAVEQFLDGLEMRAAFVAQVVEAVGRGLRELRVDFAVEQAQRIAIDAIVAVVAEFVPMRATPFHERLAKGRPALLIADRIDFHRERNFEVAAKLVDHYQQLGVAGRVGPAEYLDAELKELAIAALLRAFATEHRARIEQPLLGIGAIEPGLDVCAHDAGRAFGPKRDDGFAFVAIGERVHLLFDDVRGFAGRALVELRALQHRNADLLDRIALDERARPLLDETHRARVGAD